MHAPSHPRLPIAPMVAVQGLADDASLPRVRGFTGFNFAIVGYPLTWTSGTCHIPRFSSMLITRSGSGSPTKCVYVLSDINSFLRKGRLCPPRQSNPTPFSSPTGSSVTADMHSFINLGASKAQHIHLLDHPSTRRVNGHYPRSKPRLGETESSRARRKQATLAG